MMLLFPETQNFSRGLNEHGKWLASRNNIQILEGEREETEIGIFQLLSFLHQQKPSPKFMSSP